MPAPDAHDVRTAPDQGSAAPPAPGPGGRVREARRPRPIFLLVGVVIAAALGVGLFTGVGTRSASGPPVAGASVPAFSLPRLGGHGTVAVPAAGGGNGTPAILLFFASWCGPCQAEVPAVARTYRRQQRVGSHLAKVALIGVDVSDPKANALAFVHRSGVTFPVGADASSTVMNGVFEFTGLPDTVFVEGNGKIAAIHRGALTSSGLVSWEKKLLATAG